MSRPALSLLPDEPEDDGREPDSLEDEIHQAEAARRELERPLSQYLRWPYAALDYVMGQWAPGELAIAAAFSGGGKTLFTTNVEHELLLRGQTVYHIGLETPPAIVRLHFACLKLGYYVGDVVSGEAKHRADWPEMERALRAEINARAKTVGWPTIHAELAALDPATAQRLAPNDAQRIQRALEVCLMSGRPASALYAEQQQQTAPPYRFLSLALLPSDRSWLHERIAQRFEQMMAGGFLDEVRQLRARGDLHPDLPSMRCVGYRQAWQGLDEGLSEAEIRERGIFATRQLAKRQLTWLRSMPHRQVVAADAANALSQVLQWAL
mgnify:CR=1 FL=1